MFRNYLLLAIRNMRKNKLHTFINTLGMIVSFACSIFIVLLVYRHFTFDDFEINKSKIAKVYVHSIGPDGEETGTAMPYPLTPALKAENIGVERATSVLNDGKLVRYKEKTLDMITTMVDEDFLTMFSFPVEKGNAHNPLGSTSNCVLTQISAAKIFGAEDPIGKAVEVKLEGTWNKLIVSAVVKDFPENSSVRFSLLARTELFPGYSRMYNQWDNKNHIVYVQLAKSTTRRQAESGLRNLLKKYAPVDEKLAVSNGYRPDNNGDYESLRLLPFSEMHFNTQLGGGSATNKTFLYVLILISSVIVLIASFNFVNLNIGLSFTRTKEIGIRKCLGAGKKQIWLQVWGESFLLVFISMLVAMGIVVLLIKSFNEQFNLNMNSSLLLQPVVIVTLASLVPLVSFIASGYPSAVMAKLKTVEILKGKITVKKPGFLRNALIVTQFVIAIVLICGTVIIYQQFDYLRSAPLGYDTRSVISIPIKNDDKGREVVAQLRTQLASDPAVLSVSGSEVNLGMGEDHSQSMSVLCFNIGARSVCGQMVVADHSILKTLGIKPITGRDFSMEYAGDTSAQAIVTKTYAAQFNQKNLVGFSFYPDSAQPPVRIVGIIPDIQIKSLNDQQRPIVIFLSKDKSMSYALVNVHTGNPVATMNMIKKTYAQIEPGVEFKGSYVDENIERLYKEEKIMASLFTIAAAIAIILSCMGLFGIASIVIRQRIKEIGVRKVLGASVSNIFTLVSREFIRPVIVAFCIAVPVAWWAMNSWLQNYSHRVSVSWWVFLLAGILALLITMCTVSFQSIKAAIANPVKSLRTE